MATTHMLRETTASQATAGTSTSTTSESVKQYTPGIRYTAGIIRLAFGWTFLWAFLDKTFGLGHETASKDAWIHGGSPTYGFLKFGAVGPFKGFYNSIAGQGWADWLFMIALAGIGIALLLGVFVNIATASAVVLLVMMWSVTLPSANNIFMDDHLIYAGTLVLLALLGAGRWLGLGAFWEKLSLVKRAPILR